MVRKVHFYLLFTIHLVFKCKIQILTIVLVSYIYNLGIQRDGTKIVLERFHNISEKSMIKFLAGYGLATEKMF